MPAALRRWFDRRAAAWIRRRHGEDRLPLALGRRRIYILPSRAGAIFGLLLLAMLLAGLNYGNSLALLLTFSLGGFCIVGMNQCHRNLLGLAIAELHVEPAFAGEAIRVSVTLENPAAAARHDLRIGAEGAWTACASLNGGARQRVLLELPPRARGAWPLPRLRIETRFPFGLFRAWSWLQPAQEMLVYPAPRGELAPPPGEGRSEASVARATAGLDEWRDLRPFRDGDSPRQVAWKAYARGAPLLVREYEGAAAETLCLDYERIPGRDAEARLSQLCRWILDAEARGTRYALQLPGSRFGEGRGAAQRERCLGALARHGGAGRQDA